MRIFLLRHGETDWNLQGRCQGVADLDLNERGKQQAAEVGKYLSGEKIAALYSSDLKRALHTAEAIRQFHDVELTVDRDFRELNHGELEGLTFTDVRSRYPDFIEKWRSEPAELTVPGGERLIDVERRAGKAIERIARTHLSRDTVIIVSHNFPILAVLCRITGTPLNQYRSFRVLPCAVNGLSYDSKEGWKIIQADGSHFVGSIGQGKETFL